jgi:hypothetical protein
MDPFTVEAINNRYAAHQQQSSDQYCDHDFFSRQSVNTCKVCFHLESLDLQKALEALQPFALWNARWNSFANSLVAASPADIRTFVAKCAEFLSSQSVP